MSVWVWVANILGWPLIHLTVSWVFMKLDSTCFDPNGFFFRERSWEQGGDFYLRAFSVKRWKSRLPDGAAWFAGGFAKKKLQRRDTTYLQRFILETCRGEAAHWVTMSLAPVFFIWNPLWASAVMLVYAVLANAPCIIVQRYNRVGLRRLLNIKVLGRETRLTQ